MEQIFLYLIPFFIFLTSVALVIGVYGMMRGGKYSGNFSNRMMRKRIIFQFFAIVVAMLFLYFSGFGPR